MRGIPGPDHRRKRQDLYFSISAGQNNHTAHDGVYQQPKERAQASPHRSVCINFPGIAVLAEFPVISSR
jgi:hypothetical protein